VDDTPPTASITTRPPTTTASHDATFTFSANEPATYTCSLDGGAYVPCNSPTSYSNLPVGNHTFSVKAKDAAGNESVIVSYAWTISPPADKTPPVVAIDIHPDTTTTATSASFTWTASESAVFLCSLDGGAYYDCTSPVQFSGLGAGQHIFSVKAVDVSGNTSESASFTWTVEAAVAAKGPVLSLTADSSKKVLAVGEPAILTITVRNEGDAPSLNTVIQIALPANARLVPGSLPKDCTVAKRVVTCQLGDLPAGKEVSISLQIVATAPGPLVSNFTVTAEGLKQVAGVNIQQRVEAAKKIVKVVTPGDVLFDFDSCVVKPEGRRFLLSLRPLLKRANAARVDAYTDSMGSESYNLRLSSCRAKAVAKILFAKGAPNRVILRGLGGSNPVASNETAYGRHLNRRGVITLWLRG
jgi:uncharacterized repeat protein (TIGR01451 family)